MIKGFEEETYELTDEEQKVAHFVYKLFKAEREVCLASKRIVSEYKCLMVKATRIRKVIHFIRENYLYGDEFIVATNKGYILTRDKKLMKDYSISMRQRISSQMAILEAVEERLK